MLYKLNSQCETVSYFKCQGHNNKIITRLARMKTVLFLHNKGFNALNSQCSINFPCSLHWVKYSET